MNRTLEDYGRIITLTEAEKMSVFEDYEWDNSDRRVIAWRVHGRYLKAKGGIPYALRFKAWCKKWGVEL